VRTHDPLLLLPTSPAANGSSSLWVCRAPKVFRYIGRRLFGEVYTLCFKGDPQTAVPMRTGAATGKNCFTLHSMAGSWPSPFVSLLPQRQSRQAHRFRCSPRVWAELLSYPYNQQYDVSPDGQRFLMNRDNRHGFQDAWFSRLEPRVHDAWQHCLRRVDAGAGHGDRFFSDLAPSRRYTRPRTTAEAPAEFPPDRLP
jgi:hypothetical protein